MLRAHIVKRIAGSMTVAVLLAVGLCTSPVHAAGEKIVIGMPFTGKWAYDVATNAACGTTAHPSCHATNGTDLLGYNWAVDYYAANGTAVTLNGASAQGAVTFTTSALLSGQSCGQGVKATAKANGVAVGEAYATHLANAATSQTLNSGASVGQVANMCYGVNHVHFSYKNISGYSCYVNRSTPQAAAGVDAAIGAPVGVFGSSNSGNQQACSEVPDTSNETPGPDDPKGNFEELTQVNGGVKIKGWTIDPNTSNPVDVHVYEGDGSQGAIRAIVSANNPRPDVGAVNPGAGDNHGFTVTVPVATGTPGTKTYCAYAINVGAGTKNTKLGCRTVTFNWTPYGSYEQLSSAPGGVHIRGWAIDPDTSSPIDVHIYEGPASGGAIRAIVSANGARPDVGAGNPGYGDNHGFTTTVGVGSTMAGITKTYCAYAINTANGPTNTDLGCKTITLSDTPTGNFEEATTVSGGVHVKGWALDPNTGNAIQVHFYANSIGFARIADKTRPDVAGNFPAYGVNHGFDETLSLAPGSYNLCAYAINDGAGSNSPQLGCKQMVVK